MTESHASQQMKYRTDIDGLRAVAVLMVVFYHAGFNFVPGGFVGVDIFFVISGFLITGIVFREIQNDTFTFSGFYARRIKRILPAFYAVGFTTLIAGYFLLLPSSYASLSASLLAASLFVSNIFFWRETGGYFGGNAQEMPLLHTWSLSVEEQFYFIWPILILFIYRKFPKQALVPLTITAIILMFCIAEWGAKSLPGPTYYLLPTRSGELLLGSLLALTPDLGANWNKRTLNFISLVGLIALITPSVFLSEQSTFPGLNSFWPCLGAALIILSGRDKDVISARLLSLKPAVFIGLISYSLYLWHWPIVAFVGYLQYELTPHTGSFIVFTSIGLAFVSWKYIEQPFRRHNASFQSLSVSYFAIPCAITAAVFLYGISNKSSFNDDLQSPYLEIRSHEARKLCHTDSAAIPDIKDCRMGSIGASTKSILWGDSHANSLAGFFNAAGIRADEEIIDITFGDCPPLINTQMGGAKIKMACTQRNNNVANLIKNEKSISNVYIIGAYDGYLAASYSYPIEKIKAGLLNTINLVISSGKQAILPIDVPRFRRSSYIAGLKNKLFFTNKISYEINDTLTYEMKSVLKMYGEIAAIAPNIRFIDVRSLLCKQGHCSPYVNELPMYEDGNHLNWRGSEYLGMLYIEQNSGKFKLDNWAEISKKYSQKLTPQINGTL